MYSVCIAERFRATLFYVSLSRDTYTYTCICVREIAKRSARRGRCIIADAVDAREERILLRNAVSFSSSTRFICFLKPAFVQLPFILQRLLFDERLMAIRYIWGVI